MLTQDTLEELTNKFALPIAILGAAAMTAFAVAAILGMWAIAPGPAGTPEGPPIYMQPGSR